MDSATEPYQYDALDGTSPQVRLLSLMPAEDKNAKVCCTLKTATFPPEEAYDALSYVWGSLEAVQTVSVNGRSLAITENLHTALRNIRHQTKAKTLWADGICINQQSIDDKNNQVRIMKDIFATAETVLVWIGEEDTALGPIIRHLDRNSCTENPAEVPSTSSVYMFGHPWWSRVWTLQEFAVAQNDPVFVCGSSAASWESIREILTKKVPGDDRPLRSAVLISVHNGLKIREVDLLRMMASASSRSLDELVLRMKGRHASDKRDYIFGLVGLMKDSASALQPDYTKSTAYVYQQATMWAIGQSSNLDILFRAPYRRVTGLASWCVDFSCTSFVSPTLQYAWLPGSDIYSADGRKQMPDPKYDPDAGTIEVTGVRLSLVETMHSLLGVMNKSGRIAKWELFLEFLARFTVASHHCLSRRWSREEVARFLAAGNTGKLARGISDAKFKGQGDDMTATFPEGYSLMCAHALGANRITELGLAGLFPRIPENLAYLSSKCTAAMTAMAKNISPGCLFTTDAGYIGHSGHPISKGDVVCLLYGFSVPAVLREQGDGTYKFVTFAYVDGLMRGQFFRENADYKEDIFILR